jgi:hypothetical protein
VAPQTLGRNKPHMLEHFVTLFPPKKVPPAFSLIVESYRNQVAAYFVMPQFGTIGGDEARLSLEQQMRTVRRSRTTALEMCSLHMVTESLFNGIWGMKQSQVQFGTRLGRRSLTFAVVNFLFCLNGIMDAWGRGLAD